MAWLNHWVSIVSLSIWLSNILNGFGLGFRRCFYWLPRTVECCPCQLVGMRWRWSRLSSFVRSQRSCRRLFAFCCMPADIVLRQGEILPCLSRLPLMMPLHVHCDRIKYRRLVPRSAAGPWCIELDTDHVQTVGRGKNWGEVTNSIFADVSRIVKVATDTKELPDNSLCPKFEKARPSRNKDTALCFIAL